MNCLSWSQRVLELFNVYWIKDVTFELHECTLLMVSKGDFCNITSPYIHIQISGCQVALRVNLKIQFSFCNHFIPISFIIFPVPDGNFLDLRTSTDCREKSRG